MRGGLVLKEREGGSGEGVGGRREGEGVVKEEDNGEDRRRKGGGIKGGDGKEEKGRAGGGGGGRKWKAWLSGLEKEEGRRKQDRG